MQYKNISELRSRSNRAYTGLKRLTLRLPAEDIEALKEYAQMRKTTANEVIRVIISETLTKDRAGGLR